MNIASKSLNVFLVLGTAGSVVLWMPLGIGYYGWPWQRWGWRVALYFFVIAFLAGAVAGCLAAFRGGVSAWRFALPVTALFVSLFSVFALFFWLRRYVEPMLHGAYPHL